MSIMETTNHIAYDIDKSSQRMDDILGAGNGNFSDSDSIPQRSLLTYTNGYYVNVTALFIDIIGSSDMTDEHKRPTLAKIYRCNGVQREHNKKLNNGLPILLKVPPK